ncbi:BCL2/adenovirus E1B 19 kDa protein-interacting protein 2 isoform X2 [Anguilla anguilla]|uniref:BCL2/adenovirus E1B 19 kDa protein-interacting protein 2 isoform X2 n=1 Tax=Anguilla anguilla TaxID=7936 RepID=UPI0015AA9081|nr:BCL2/adenovirus E1B 19 kDa protein-interacting protein 2 isoform X2 [Anguilla anguilla]
MATECTESDAGLIETSNVIDMNSNNSSSEPDTPSISEDLENRPATPATLTSGEDEADFVDKTSPSSEKCDVGEPQCASDAEASGPPQQTTTPDNEHVFVHCLETQPIVDVQVSSPVELPRPNPSSIHNGSLERQESVATTEARLRMEGVELKEEWQDEDFPRPLPEEEEDIQMDEELFTGAPEDGEAATQPCGSNRDKKVKKKLVAPDISLTLDRSDGSVLSDELEESGDLDLDEIDTPSDNSNEFEWEDDLPKPKARELLHKGVESVPEYSAAEEREEGRRWRVFRIGEQEHRVDMKAIEPYKRVISHGGYYGDGLNAVIVFAVCFMPESSQPNYRYIMDNLFKYVIGTLELLVAENYMIVYLNGATSRRKMPSVGWLRKCYQQIDRRLRKNLKSLIIVHPSWFIRTLLAITKPFISSKFSQKIKYVFSLMDLAELVPMEYVSIPECIKEIDRDMHGKAETTSAAAPQ